MARHEFIVNGEVVSTSAERIGDRTIVTVGDNTYTFIRLAANQYSLLREGGRMDVAVVRVDERFYIDIDSQLLDAREVVDDPTVIDDLDHSGEKDKVYAPMPGKVVKLLVKQGDTVKPGQQLVIVEAMKMENPVVAAADGTVKAVNFKEGDQVDTEAAIIELTLAEE